MSKSLEIVNKLEKEAEEEMAKVDILFQGLSRIISENYGS